MSDFSPAISRSSKKRPHLPTSGYLLRIGPITNSFALLTFFREAVLIFTNSKKTAKHFSQSSDDEDGEKSSGVVFDDGPELEADYESRTVIHFQFYDWPDFGVPPTDHFLNFLLAVSAYFFF